MNCFKGLPRNQGSTPWHLEETYKGLIPPVAILAYLENLARYAAHQPDMIRPLMWFCAGLLASAITFIVAYHVQLRLYIEERDKADRKAVSQLHGYLITLGSLLLIFAAIAFSVGCYTAASAMKKATHPGGAKARVAEYEAKGDDATYG